MDSYQTEKQAWIKDRNNKLKEAARSGEGPSIWSRLAEYPQDFSFGMEANRKNPSLTGPLSNPELQQMDQQYKKALEEAIRTRKAPSGWSGL